MKVKFSKIYVFAVLASFDMPYTNHFVFCRVFVFGRFDLLFWGFDKGFGGLELSKEGWTF